MQTLVERRIYPFLLMVFILLAILSFQIRQFKRLYEHIKNDKWVVVILFYTGGLGVSVGFRETPVAEPWCGNTIPFKFVKYWQEKGLVMFAFIDACSRTKELISNSEGVRRGGVSDTGVCFPRRQLLRPQSHWLGDWLPLVTIATTFRYRKMNIGKWSWDVACCR